MLSYLPEGYVLEKEDISNTVIRYQWINNSSETIYFEQRPLTQSNLFIDTESGYSQIKEIEEYDVYYRFTNRYHHYIWNIENYSMTIKSKTPLPNEEIVFIIDGITVK